MSNSNAMIIRKVYQDFARGDISAVFAAFDASIAWHVPGHSPLSGDYNGHDQIGGFFRRTMELSGGAFSIGAGTKPVGHCGVLWRSWRATVDEDGHYSFAVPL
jgi:ketosteroid isomerase-like protein